MTKRIIIALFITRFVALEYADALGVVPEFGTYQQALAYIEKHNLGPSARPAEITTGGWL